MDTESAGVFRVDRNAFSTGRLSNQPEDREEWSAKTPRERLLAVEINRRLVYGDSPATARLQRFFEITRRS